MLLRIEVPTYHPERGLEFQWELGYQIVVKQDSEGLTIAANREGLISLARILLTLAQEEVPGGHHVHLDDSNSLEHGSSSLIIEKV